MAYYCLVAWGLGATTTTATQHKWAAKRYNIRGNKGGEMRKLFGCFSDLKWTNASILRTFLGIVKTKN